MLIIIDLDGTIADSSERAKRYRDDRERYWSPEAIAQDKVMHHRVRDVLSALQAQHHTIVIVSERVESCRAATERWLMDKLELRVDDATLKLRSDRDNMLPPEAWKRGVAAEVAAELGESPTNPRTLAIDDEPHALELYEEFGALTLQAPACWDLLYVDVPAVERSEG